MVEEEIKELLEKAREDGWRYASAHYREERGGGDGLAIRLEAIEAALLRLASAMEVDQGTADDRRGS